MITNYVLWENGKARQTTERGKAIKLDGVGYSLNFLKDMALIDREALSIFPLNISGSKRYGAIYSAQVSESISAGTVTRTYTKVLRSVSYLKQYFANKAKNTVKSNIISIKTDLAEYPITLARINALNATEKAIQAHKDAIDLAIRSAATEEDFLALETLSATWPTVEDQVYGLDEAKAVRKDEVNIRRVQATGLSYTHDFGGSIGIESFQVRNDNDMVMIMSSFNNALYQQVIGNGSTVDVSFRMESNTKITLKAEDFTASVSSMYNFLFPAFNNAWAHRDAIDAISTTVEDIENYNIDTGW